MRVFDAELLHNITQNRYELIENVTSISPSFRGDGEIRINYIGEDGIFKFKYCYASEIISIGGSHDYEKSDK